MSVKRTEMIFNTMDEAIEAEREVLERKLCKESDDGFPLVDLEVVEIDNEFRYRLTWIPVTRDRIISIRKWNHEIKRWYLEINPVSDNQFSVTDYLGCPSGSRLYVGSKLGAVRFANRIAKDRLNAFYRNLSPLA